MPMIGQCHVRRTLWFRIIRRNSLLSGSCWFFLHEPGGQRTSANENMALTGYPASVCVYATTTERSVSQRHTVRTEEPVPLVSQQKVSGMKTIQVYDKPLRCSTGLWGPQVYPVLPRFGADLDTLKNAGHTVEQLAAPVKQLSVTCSKRLIAGWPVL